MREVQVLQATKTAPNSRGRNNNYAVQIDRIRVAAYCRVSTDGDEQLGSFESQKLYYEEKIRKNKEWAMAGIFADEAIVSREIWDKAEEIRLKRAKPKLMQATGNRERYTRQFTFSSMLECGYCGHKLSRRTRHQTTTTKKPVWQCMNAIKNGIDSCPNCKAVDEVIIENAFLEAFRLLADNFDDVLQSVLNTI